MNTAGDRPPDLRPERKYGLQYKDDLPIDMTGRDYSGTMVCGKCGWIHHQGPHVDVDIKDLLRSLDFPIRMQVAVKTIYLERTNDSFAVSNNVLYQTINDAVASLGYRIHPITNRYEP